MFKIEWKKLRAYALVTALAVAGTVALMPAKPVRRRRRRGRCPTSPTWWSRSGPRWSTSARWSARAAPARPPAAQMDEEMQEFFRRFFGQPMPGRPAPGAAPEPAAAAEEEEQPRGVGSGFILTPDGFVMTNAHVVEGADEVLVTLPDKREFKAKIIGADKRTDVAVVKIEATGLPAVKVGDVSRLKVGEWVMAIGSPFGLENTVTAGIVSAKQRDTGDYLPFIQTDVAINPGNSGGPLINMRGEVVGINSQIYSRSGGFMGISFAIPIDEAIRVSEQLRASGRVSRGRIGVQIDQVTKDVAESIGLGKPQGALVRSVESRLAGRQGGRGSGRHHHQVRRQGDRQGARPAAPGGQHQARHAQHDDGVPPRRLARPERHRSPRSSPRSRCAAPPSKEEKPKGSPAAQVASAWSVSELTDAQKKELKIKGGVKVEAVTDGAARAGIREGDIIVAIGNTEIGSVKEFDAAVAKVDKSKPIPVLLRRGELASYLLIRPAR